VSDGTLSVLGQKLRSLGIPWLSVLISRLEEAGEYEDFVALVREFLPEREREILCESTPHMQIATFASYFEDSYFPLDDRFKMGDFESYGDLTRFIPVIPLGLSYDDYEMIASDWRGGFQLMTYLIENPFSEGRAALAEACEEYVPGRSLERVPEEGFSPAELSRLLDGSQFKALVDWAWVMWHDTGNFFLDADYEELWNTPPPEWGKETVGNLTTQWHQAETTQQGIQELAERLEEDPPARFEELLSFILQRRGNGTKV
jgi:hypothetical protein